VPRMVRAGTMMSPLFTGRALFSESRGRSGSGFLVLALAPEFFGCETISCTGPKAHFGYHKEQNSRDR
jgi:hypothetical protein